ncbi:MAG: hypothetical protein AABX88_03220 [Nanoarchaeota archaeon]
MGWKNYVKQLDYVEKCVILTLVVLIIAIITAIFKWGVLKELVWYAVVISFISCFVSIIIYQFKDKRVLWGIINLIVLIIYISNYRIDEEITTSSFIGLFISSMLYYHYFIGKKYNLKIKPKS